jgi:hypothetical protein
MENKSKRDENLNRLVMVPFANAQKGRIENYDLFEQRENQLFMHCIEPTLLSLRNLESLCVPNRFSGEPTQLRSLTRLALHNRFTVALIE